MRAAPHPTRRLEDVAAPGAQTPGAEAAGVAGARRLPRVQAEIGHAAAPAWQGERRGVGRAPSGDLASDGPMHKLWVTPWGGATSTADSHEVDEGGRKVSTELQGGGAPRDPAGFGITRLGLARHREPDSSKTTEAGPATSSHSI